MHLTELHLIQYDTLDSTQLEAKRMFMEKKLQHGMALTAKTMTAGYGKYNRKWESSHGNLAVTVVINIADITFPYQLSYVTAIAVGDMILSLNPNIDMSYKWVNDIMIADKKVCGILLEQISPEFLLIGVGLNVDFQETVPDREVTHLAAHNINTQHLDFCNLFLESFQSSYNSWLDYGFIKTRNKWQERAYKMKQEVLVKNKNREYTGVMLGISDTGNLILQKKTGEIEQVIAGDMW